jgi:ubiquitin C-terminal hydrolase
MSSEESVIPHGIPNIGDSCWLNVIIQVTFICSSIIELKIALLDGVDNKSVTHITG